MARRTFKVLFYVNGSKEKKVLSPSLERDCGAVQLQAEHLQDALELTSTYHKIHFPCIIVNQLVMIINIAKGCFNKENMKYFTFSESNKRQIITSCAKGKQLNLRGDYGR